jgi:transcriptional regulator with PAS, ATPase and Fis domain
MLEVVKYGYEDELALHKYVPGYTRDADDDFVLVSRACVRDEKGDLIAGITQVHFRQQMVENAKQMLREYNAMEFYRQEYECSDRKNYTFQNIVGTSKCFQRKIKEGIKAAKTNFPVVLTGETGTGKEVFARAIHNTSARAKMPMVCINCAAIPAELLESELFGYEEGAFTGAKKGGRKGKFQMADGGTIFLDEIGDMPLSMQVKLLRVLQEREVDPVGGRESIPVDVRVISATRKDLVAMLKRGEFREDLYYRLNVINIELPPLRCRKEDIAEQAVYFLNKLNNEYKQSVAFSKEVLESLQEYEWPGNSRELDNVIKGAYATCDGFTIDLADLPWKFQTARGRKLESGEGAWPSGKAADSHASGAAAFLDWEKCSPLPMKERLERIEYAMIQDAYNHFQSVRKAAGYLGMSLATFVRKKNFYSEKYG